MNVFSILKNNSEDLFILTHPSIKKFKREAKVLHKELKQQSYTLMQCQELVVKKYSFNNWHHFQQVLKNQYQNKGGSIFNLRRDIKLNIENKEYVLGYDIINEEYLYQDNKSASIHRFIYGLRNTEYDMFLMKQAIKNDCPLFFLNGIEDNSIQELSDYAQIHSSKKVVVIGADDFHLHNSFNQYNTDFFSHLLSSMFYEENIENRDEIKDIFMNFMLISFHNIFKDKNDKEIYSLEYLLKQIEEESILKDSENYFSKALMNVFKEEDIKKIALRKDYLQLKNLVVKFLEKIIALKIFSFKEKSVPIEINDEYIYLINCSNKISSLFFTSLFRGHMSRQLSYCIEGNPSEQSDIKKKKRKELGYFPVFLRDIQMFNGISVISSQARAIGFSINWSYSNHQFFEDERRDQEIILANSGVKIIHSSNQNTNLVKNEWKEIIPEKNDVKLNDFYYIYSNELNRVSIDNIIDLW